MIVGHFQEKVGKCRNTRSENLINQFLYMIKVVTIIPPKQNNFGKLRINWPYKILIYKNRVSEASEIFFL